MRVLWFSHLVPYPPAGGASQRSFNLIREVSRLHTVELVAFNSQGLPKARLDEYSKALQKYCGRVEIWEMPTRWRRSLRWWMGLAASPFSSVPYNCQCFWSRELAARWTGVLEKHRDFVLHFDSPDLALYADEAAGFPKILNHHNCESVLIHRRGLNARNPLKKAYLLNQAQKLARLEREVCPRFPVNVVCSEIDAQALRDHGAKIHTHLVENGVDTDYFRPVPGAEEADTLIFTGLLNWEPNIDGIQYFVQEIWPIVERERPGARLYLAGRDPVPLISRLQTQDHHIVVVPNPEDMRPWLARAAVSVCPILEGGGTRIKILDAMAMGKAVVTTSVGCEGLAVRHGENILVAESSANFASSIVDVLNDPKLRERMGGAGRAFVETRHDWLRIGVQLKGAYCCALDSGQCEEKAAPRVAARPR